MILFLLTFISLYGGMHLYVFIRLYTAFHPRPYVRHLMIAGGIIMTMVPLLVRSAEHLGMEQTAQFIAWPGYVWMGFLFIFTCTLLLTDCVTYLYRTVLRRVFKDLPEFTTTRPFCILALVTAVTASAYAALEARQIRSEHIIISSSKISTAVPRIRIVQISDVHIGLLHGENRLHSIIDRVREASPDILISTGDLVNGKLNRDFAISGRDPLAQLLATVPAPSGKFAIIGNHEVYAGLPQAEAFTRTAGFTLLRNRSSQLAFGVIISGIDDRAVTRTSVDAPGAETTLVTAAPQDSFHILLKHRPDILPASDGRFDLQLSGHVHNGQIFPFNLLVRLKHPIPCGTSTTPSGSKIYVSRGTGTWGPPMRLFAPPEITIIDLVPGTSPR